MSGIREIPHDLVERVESGEGWDSALDKDILRAFGFTWRGMDYWSADNKRIWKGETCFTAKIDAVVSLIEQKLPGAFADVDVASLPKGQELYGARIFSADENPWSNVAGEAKSPARALLAACLRALQAKLPEHADANIKSPIQAREE